MLDAKMKEVCRICARELCGNQRRWIFHPASKLNLQVLLSHALGRELTRDGKGEFACSKCAFMLERMYRFDTVIARVEALSIERLQKLLLEKDRLRQCIGGLYRKANAEEPGPGGGAGADGKARECTVDISGLHDVKYNALLQEDFAYSVYESWAEHEDQVVESQQQHHHCHASEFSTQRSRRCRGCAALRVADSDYEAVCRVPRKLARSTSCGPSTRYSASVLGSACSEEPSAAATLVPESLPATSESDRTLVDADLERMSAGSSVESLDAGGDVGQPAVKEEEEEEDRDAREDQRSESLSEEQTCLQGKLELALSLVKSCEYRPVPSPRGSRLPVRVKPVSPGSNSSRTAFSDLSLRAPYGRGCESSTCYPELVPPQPQPNVQLELAELEEMWQDVYVEYRPFRFQKNLIEEQQAQLNQYECAAGQCVSELQKAQLQVQSLQAKIQESEANNKKLQEKLFEMESELRSIRQAAQKKERTIQSLSDTVSTKDTEAEELYRVIEGQNDMLCKLKEIAHHNQLQTLQVSKGEPTQLHSELLALQSSLFSTQLELQGSQRAHQRSQRQAADLARARDRLQGDLQGALQHGEVTEKHNQELRGQLQEARSALELKESQLKEKEGQRQAEAETRDKSIQQLRLSLREKEQLVQEYSELLDQQRDPSHTQDTLLDKLKNRIKDRDKALERAIDDKFRCLEEKEGDIRRLQLALREKEKDLEKLRYVLSNNEETITHLDSLVRSKELQLEQVSEASRNLQRLKKEAEERLGRSLREREALISQLQGSLQARSKEAEELRAALISKVSVGGSELVEEMKGRLQLKERLFQEVLSDRSRQAQEHQSEVQQLLHTISTRDQYIKDSAGRLGQVISEQADSLQELRRQLVSREREVRELRREKEQQGWDPRHEISRLQSQLKQKEAFIQELMKDSQEEPMITSGAGEAAVGRVKKGQCDSGLQGDIQTVQEELQLLLRKEKEAQMELSTLRSALAKDKEEMQTQAAELEALTRSGHSKEQLIKDLQRQLVEPSGLSLVERLTQELQELRESVIQQDPTSPDHQSILAQLVSDYYRLNDAVKTEKQLYHSLTQIHSCRDSSEKTRKLQTELDKVQALRGQLEEVLTKARDSALAPQRAAKIQPDFGGGKQQSFRLHPQQASWAVGGAGLSTEEEDDDDDGSSEYTDSIEEEENSKLTARTLATSQNAGITCDKEDGGLMSRMLSQDATVDAQGLVKVQQLLEQKRVVERELRELKAQLEKAGYTSLSQMRTALLSLRMENDELNEQEGQVTSTRREKGETGRLSKEGHQQGSNIPEEEEEEEEDGRFAAVLAESGEELGLAQGKRCAPRVQLREGQGKRRCTRPHSLDLGALLSQHTLSTCTQEADLGESEAEARVWQYVEAGLREKTLQLRSDLALSRQESRDLQERLMVSEATVQAQAEQLKDYRELLTETSVQQDSKQVQVDLQDLGYETCGRSENEAERDDTSSPEFDDLEMCTSLSRRDCGSEWWAGNSGKGGDVASLQQLVEDLRAQLSRSQVVIRNLQGQVRSLSSSSLERPRKLNWAFQASPALSGPEEDEGWQSDGLGPPEPGRSQELRELVSRVASLEDQLKNSKLDGKAGAEDTRSATWPGKFNSLIQAQARELSHLRQRMREGRGVCHILTQHLGDTTKAFEELLRTNDVDYYTGQSFREQLAQSSALAERVNAKISGRDHSELPDDKMGHELLALRLSKELQQKDKIIESLRTKLKQQRPDTPSSSHALSETTDQSDRTSFVSDEQGSTHEDLELCSDVDAASEYTPEERPCPRQTLADSHCHSGTTPQHSSVPSSTTASHGAQSSIGCPSMPCTPHKPVDNQGLSSGPMSNPLPMPLSHDRPDLSGQRGSMLFDPHSALLRPGYHGAGAFSLAEVHQELQMLQRQLGESFAVPHVKPLSGFPLAARSQPDPGSYLSLSHHAFPQPQLATTPNASSTLKADLSLLESSALWDMSHIPRPIRTGIYGDVSSGSSGYQSGTSHTGADLIEEHLREIRSLRQRLEDSIRTNDRLRQQLEERLATTGREGGAPTNIYIQGLDSVSQLSNENRALKEENLGLQARLEQANRDSCKEMEQLREAVVSGRARLKQAELEVEQWREENRRLQAHSCEQAQEIQQLRQTSQERTNRLRHEVHLLQQQLSESRQLLHSLQCELQVYERVCGAAKSPRTAGYGAQEPELSQLLVEVRGLRVQLERSVQENSSLRTQLEEQLGGGVARGETRPSSISIGGHRDSGCRKQLFHDPAPSPPVRDTGLFNPGSSYSMLSKSTELNDPDLTTNDILKPHAALEGEAPDGSFASKKGRHAVGHVDDFNALQQQILEGKVLVQKMEAALQSSLSSALLEVGSAKAVDYSCMKSLLTNAKTLGQILDEAASLLKMFWRAALPSSEASARHLKKEQSMKEEIQQLRQRITEQERMLQDAIERLRNTNRSKESMEHFIVGQLSRTRDVLKKARTNLEKNEYKISSLCSSSSSPRLGEIPRGSREHPPDWGFVSPRGLGSAIGTPSQRDSRNQGGPRLLQLATY
ncbi:myomegalin isoform X3 [Megalops cyprinoides]|uniref:myomegalin isoform X3 n=1 Tax=Megalops cyprinoides TaxID=118141 RepID=UPI001864646E|nr:myomegalin isoform X3 [Megalops cyprinoides]